MSQKTPWIRPLTESLHPYTPGEQPLRPGLIKLNTNENPYPPSPKTLQALRDAVNDELRLYPNPTSESLRKTIASAQGCEPDQVLVGNGSDDLLALAVRAFTEPCGHTAKHSSISTVQYFQPSYSLYPVLAANHGAAVKHTPLSKDYSLPSVKALEASGSWDFKAALTFITTPNAPSGRGYTRSELRPICEAQQGVVVLDEAYADFAKENAMQLALDLPNCMVFRTFSKAYSLCRLRVGYAVGPQPLIAAINKHRDSYNVNGMAQTAAEAALLDMDYYREGFKRIIQTRENFSKSLADLGFETLPSQTNFVLTRPPGSPAEKWFEALREANILVRWFKSPEISAFLRISIGSESEMDKVLETLTDLKSRLTA